MRTFLVHGELLIRSQGLDPPQKKTLPGSRFFESSVEPSSFAVDVPPKSRRFSQEVQMISWLLN